MESVLLLVALIVLSVVLFKCVSPVVRNLIDFFLNNNT